MKIIAGCGTLGINDKLVTGTCCQKCETIESILDINPVIEKMQRNFLPYSLIRNLDFWMLIFTRIICMMHFFLYKMMNVLNHTSYFRNCHGRQITPVSQQQDKWKLYRHIFHSALPHFSWLNSLDTFAKIYIKRWHINQQEVL